MHTSNLKSIEPCKRMALWINYSSTWINPQVAQDPEAPCQLCLPPLLRTLQWTRLSPLVSQLKAISTHLSELPGAPEHKTNWQKSASQPFCTFSIGWSGVEWKRVQIKLHINTTIQLPTGKVKNKRGKKLHISQEYNILDEPPFYVMSSLGSSNT